MKRTVAIVAMCASMGQLAGAAPQAGTPQADPSCAITGTMRGVAGTMAGVRVNVLTNDGTIIGTVTTNQQGQYLVDRMPAGRLAVQGITSAGTVTTTSAVCALGKKVVADLNTPAAAAQMAQSAGATAGSFGHKAVWWMVGSGAATAGVLGVVSTRDDASPSR